MSKTKTRRLPWGVFAPEADLTDYLEQRGDLRALFDGVHRHFFESLGEPVDAARPTGRKSGRRSPRR